MRHVLCSIQDGETSMSLFIKVRFYQSLIRGQLELKNHLQLPEERFDLFDIEYVNGEIPGLG